jgi:hypothetical protein
MRHDCIGIAGQRLRHWRACRQTADSRQVRQPEHQRWRDRGERWALDGHGIVMRARWTYPLPARNRLRQVLENYSSDIMRCNPQRHRSVGQIADVCRSGVF